MCAAWLSYSLLLFTALFFSSFSPSSSFAPPFSPFPSFPCLWSRFDSSAKTFPQIPSLSPSPRPHPPDIFPVRREFPRFPRRRGWGEGGKGPFPSISLYFFNRTPCVTLIRKTGPQLFVRPVLRNAWRKNIPTTPPKKLNPNAIFLSFEFSFSASSTVLYLIITRYIFNFTLYVLKISSPWFFHGFVCVRF